MCYWFSEDFKDYLQHENENLKMLYIEFHFTIFLPNETTNNWNENCFTKMKFHKRYWIFINKKWKFIFC